MNIFLVGVVALTAFGVLEAAFYTARFLSERRRDELKRRLSALGGGASDGGPTRGTGVLRRGKLANNPAIDALLRSIGVSARFERLLEQTDLEITVARLIAYTVAASAAGAVLGVLSGGTVMPILLSVLFGSLPFAFVFHARGRRSRRMSEQLPDALEMMARSLRAGHALSSAFRLVAQEMPAPVSIEFGRAFEAQELGMPFERAVGDMTRRAPNNQDLKIFALSVIVQKETGGNLIEIIEKIADTVRARYKFQGKLRGLTAEGRVSSYVVGSLPFFSLLVSMIFSRDYAMRLFTTEVGHYFLGYGIASWMVGFLLMSWMMKVEV